MKRGEWSIRTDTDSALRCDADYFYIGASVRAFEGEELVFERSWDEMAIPRDHL